VNGRVAVNNQTMGGDPAVGAKNLRIGARNRRNEEREFDFKEGGFIDVAMFNVHGDADRRDEWNNGPGNYGNRDGDDYPDVRIIRAYYRWQASSVNVNEVLRSKTHDGQLSFVVANSGYGRRSRCRRGRSTRSYLPLPR
jgi:hypothetical protein